MREVYISESHRGYGCGKSLAAHMERTDEIINEDMITLIKYI